MPCCLGEVGLGSDSGEDGGVLPLGDAVRQGEFDLRVVEHLDACSLRLRRLHNLHLQINLENEIEKNDHFYKYDFGEKKTFQY